MSSIFSQTPQGSVCSETSNPLQDISFKSLCSINFWPNGFSNLPVFFLAKVRCLRFNTVYHVYPSRRGHLLFNHPTGCQGSNQYRLTQGQIQCWQGGSVEPFQSWSARKLEDDSAFSSGRKGVWEWLVVDQPICLSQLRWLFQRQQCMKAPYFPDKETADFLEKLGMNLFFFGTVIGDTCYPQPQPLSLNLPFFDWVSKHQRWRCVKSEIGSIWWGNFLLPSNYSKQ